MKFKAPASVPSVSALLTAAREAEALGRFREAEALCGQMLARQPHNVDALVLLSDVALRTGRVARAQELLRSALGLSPTSPDALLRLARLLRSLGTQAEAIEAIELCHQAISATPEDAEAYFTLGLCSLDQWRIKEAVEAFEKAISRRPDFAAAFERLGFVHQVAGRDAESEKAYRHAITLSPNMPVAFVNLAKVLARVGAGEEAEALLDQADRNSKDLLALARAHRDAGNTDRAAAALRRVVAREPAADQATYLLSQTLQELGKFEEAKGILKAALSVQPESPWLYQELAYCGKVTEADAPMLEAIRRLIDKPTLAAGGRVQLHYALGKAFDDLGDYGNAIEHFHLANRTAASLTPDLSAERRSVTTAMVDAMISTFSPAYFRAHKEFGSDSAEPVFIVGMPRSGTTLTDQIVSSHPEVGAVGELNYLSRLALPMMDPSKPFSEEMASGLAEGYLRVVRASANGKARITDKMPDNFKLAGLIHLVFPNARIIHCRRNPIDTCLSIYVTPLTLPYSNSLPDIAFAYREYTRMMDHWRTVLPPDRFFELNYEDLVAEPEPLTRRVVEFLGLPWDDRALRHEGNTRTIQTASRWQVRQPIHSGSVERWRRYEPWIAELLKEFPDRDAIADRPTLA